MRNGDRELRLKVMGHGEEAEDRAVLIVDRLAGIRPVTGRCPEWRVTYSNVDVQGAFEHLAADLTAIEPRWVEVLDFAALPSKPFSEAEFS
jgi:hypothetical protein